MARRRRVLFGVSTLVAVSVGVGFVAAQRISSPADEAADAKPPAAGPVTAPLEQRALHSQITSRGDAVFDDAIDLRVDTTRLVGAAIMTSDPPEVGATIDEGDVVFEISGRPVIVLGGDLPTYRDITPGSRGPDVAQLELALQRLGIDPGTIDDSFDAATSEGLAALYQRVGFEPPAASSATVQRATAAQAAADAARQGLLDAYVALGTAMKGPTDSERLTLDSAVKTAQRALTLAQQGIDQAAIAAAGEQLQIAKAQRTEGLAPPDVSAQQAAVATAQAAVDSAATELADSTFAAGVPAPAAEIVFIPNLPRRVDADKILRGHVVDGPVMTVSGSTVVVNATLSAIDRPLVSVGMPVEVAGGTGGIGKAGGAGGGADGDIAGTIAAIAVVTTGSNPGSATVTITLDDPTTEQLEAIRGLNVQVAIPIASTSGEVLCAPLAAVSAGPGGESRVDVVAADGTERLVTVTVGLVAEGFAEIDATDDSLHPGDLVVVGR